MFGLLQRGLALVAAVGALWLLALAALGYLQLQDAVPTPDLAGFPLPTVLLLGGLLLGLLLAALTRWANGIGARRRGRRAAKALRSSVEGVAEDAHPRAGRATSSRPTTRCARRWPQRALGGRRAYARSGRSG